MACITLTTDLGLQDFYVAALKAMMLRRWPATSQPLHWVDIAHTHRAQDRMGVAFNLRAAWRYFPLGTVHVAVVGQTDDVMALSYQGHHFVGPNNGVLTLALSAELEPVHRVELPGPLPGEPPANPMLLRMAWAATQLAQGAQPAHLGPALVAPRTQIWAEPTVIADGVQGQVIHFDHFGNAITNLPVRVYLPLMREQNFRLIVKGLAFTDLADDFAAAPLGTVCAYPGDSGYIEVAVSGGSARQQLGLQVHDAVQLVFGP